MELRIKNYKQEDAAIIFQCSYGEKEFSAFAKPSESIFKQDEYEASDRVKERIGMILMNRAEKLITKQ